MTAEQERDLLLDLLIREVLNPVDGQSWGFDVLLPAGGMVGGFKTREGAKEYLLAIASLSPEVRDRRFPRL